MRNRRGILIALVIIVIVVVVVVQVVVPAFTDSTTFTLSGTIEATEIHLASQISGRVQQVYAAEGDHVTSGEKLINIYSTTGGANDEITSPIDGTVMERLIEPGELAAPGSPLMVVADLDTLTLTVYVPEDRYGEIYLGKTYPVKVDSFPDASFVGKVSHIADQAEFTPRNVQTIDGRKSTVFAIKLDLEPSGGKLKPGMPADVTFAAQ
ncbi:MAG TPA: efflux RND transporter periplasmic adaptor subunit [Aggregatilineales bacterium]|nr:efflux RND transporter periplasmic adaptor subunit [Aggregatilineales bacterium]